MNDTILLDAINMIKNDDYACIVIKNGTILTAEKGRGVSPVLRLYDKGLMVGALVVDKIIGKASAMVLSQAGVSEVYALVMSRDAERWLSDKGIPHTAETLSEVILNRTQTGLCPMEMTVADISDPVRAIEALKAKVIELSSARR